MQVRLQRPFAAVLERVDLLKCLEERFLDKVVGVGKVARPPGEAPGGPAAKERQIAGEQPVQGLAITRPCPFQQVESRFGVGQAASPCRTVDCILP
jgi:hypothetical protein